MKLFVTGANGFVGRSLIENLLQDQHDVKGLVRTNSAEKVISQLGATAVKGDLLHIQEFKNELKGIDAVIHLAAKVRFVGNYHDFHLINVVATRKLIQCAFETGVKKFIYVSAAAIVMDGKALREITETYQPGKMIKSNYLKSKLSAEQELLKRKEEIQVVILRPPAVWGPDMRLIEESRPVIQRFGYPVIGDIDHHLATCHVKNLNAAILQSLKSKKASGVYLVADDEKVIMKIFMKELIKGYGMEMGNRHISKKLALTFAGFLEFVWQIFNLKGDPPLTTFMVHFMGTEFTIDDRKIRQELGHKSVISVEKGFDQLNSLSSTEKTK